MYDLLKKSYLVGLGALTLTKDKIEEVVDELIQRGEVAEKDRSRVLSEVGERVQQEKTRLGELIREKVEKAVRETGLSTRAEIEALARRVEQLEKSAARSGPDDSGASDAGTSEGA